MTKESFVAEVTFNYTLRRIINFFGYIYKKSKQDEQMRYVLRKRLYNSVTNNDVKQLYQSMSKRCWNQLSNYLERKNGNTEVHSVKMEEPCFQRDFIVW